MRYREIEIHHDMLYFVNNHPVDAADTTDVVAKHISKRRV